MSRTSPRSSGRIRLRLGEDVGLEAPRPEDAAQDERLVADRVAVPESGDELMDGFCGHGLGRDYST